MVESAPRDRFVSSPGGSSSGSGGYVSSGLNSNEVNPDHSTHLEPSASELDTVEQRPIVSVTSGCMYAFFVVAFSGAMIFVNALACLAAYPLFPEINNDQIGTRLGQLFFFTVPLIMLLIEWHLIDRLRRLFRSSNN